MSRPAISLIVAALLGASLVAVATPSRAQIGNIFSDRPRPPAAVAPRDQGPDADEEEVPELPQGRLLPTPNRPQTQGAPPPGSFQSQPLPPPPGPATAPPTQPVVPGQGTPNIATAPPTANPNPLPGLAPGQKQPRGTPPTPATLQPGDEVVTEPPAQKIVNKQAVFAGLDKITGRIIKFDADMGETVQFGALRIKPQACYTRPVTASANTDAFVEVDEITLQGEVKRIFSGWMFAASPGLHGIEHPIYDIWLTDCKEPDATVAQQEVPKPVAVPAGQKKSLPAKQPSAAPRPQSPNPFPPFRQ
ncbi:MAG: DUF2155 domain-containing protein [Afipia sp.]|nr:DUF2155 domain-containing protein [Afipia sp.]